MYAATGVSAPMPSPSKSRSWVLARKNVIISQIPIAVTSRPRAHVARDRLGSHAPTL